MVASSSGSVSGAVLSSSSALGTQPHRVAEPRVPRSTHNLNARAANANGASDVANSNHYGAGELNTSTPGAADPLAVVLSTSGALFALQPNEPDRAAREHRRTRRGKQRRSRSMTAPLQARLFDRRG
jgi:microcystin-dependent protein